MAKNEVTSSKLHNNIKLNVGVGVVADQPVKVNQLTGTCQGDADSSGDAIVNVQSGAAWKHTVRNVRTYNASSGAEASWGAISQGAYIYYDDSPALNALGIYLSTSPNNSLGVANKIFGKSRSAHSTATASSIANVEVMQVQV